MVKYILALIALAVLTPESQACHRSVAVSRVFAIERMVLRAPAAVATAPFRFFSGRDVHRSRTVSRVAAPKVIAAPCPATGCPVPKKVEPPKKTEVPKK